MIKFSMDTSPHHIGFIMDGNRRWAKTHPHDSTYKSGLEKMQEIIKYIITTPCIQNLSFWALSTRNMHRHGIDQLFDFFIHEPSFEKTMTDLPINLRFIGHMDGLPTAVQQKCNYLQGLSTSTGLNVNVFINYSGELDLIHTISKSFSLFSDGKVHEGSDYNLEQIKSLSLCQGIPNIDLLIRTGNTRRLSDFAPFLVGYSEIRFLEDLWPDFSIKMLEELIEEYKSLDIKYGL